MKKQIRMFESKAALKIAFIVNSFPALSETFILNQITGLIDLGHEVDIYFHTPQVEEKVHPDVENYGLMSRTHFLPRVPNNKIVRAITALLLLLKNFRKSPFLLLSALNPFKYGKPGLSLNVFYTVLPFAGRKYDIIQCHYGPNGVLGAFVKKAGVGRKLVTMFHGYDLRRGKKGWGSYADMLIEQGDCFLYYTDYAFGLLTGCGIDPQKMVCHRIGINLNLFKRNFKPIDKKMTGPLTILTVARLVEEKALHLGIRAVAKLMDSDPELSLQYHIIGEGYLENPLKNLIKELKLENTVLLLGGMSREEIIQKMADSDLFLLPSQEETLGTVLLEAQAMQMPVIGTRVGGLTETIEDGVSGFLVSPQNVDAIVECISGLIHQPHTWSQMGSKGRAYVENNYDVGMLNKRLVTIYEDLLASQTAGRISNDSSIQPAETTPAV